MAYVVGGEELMFCRERLFADLVTEDMLKVKMQGSNTEYTFCEDGIYYIVLNCRINQELK